MSDGSQVPGSIWFYAPNKGAPFFFALAFAVSGVLHLWQCSRYKYFRVTGYFPFCCVLFAAGFVLRAYGAFHYDEIYIYVASTLLIYTSPPILELANYHILGRALYYVPYFSPIHPGRVLTTLGTLSAAVEVLNGLGIAYIASGPARPAGPARERALVLGRDLMRASLALQLAVIAFFYALAAVFHRRCARAGVLRARVRAVLHTLYASMLLILGRTLYRAVEHFGAGEEGVGSGVLSPVLRYEWFFYVFEAALMLANAAGWNARHPGRYLPRNFRRYLAQDGETELDGPGWGDNRNKIMTLLDPFGFLLMFEKGRTGEPFWEDNGYHHHLLERKGRRELAQGGGRESHDVEATQ